MTHHLRGVFLLALAVVLLAGASLAAAEEAKVPPEAKPEFLVSEMRIQRLPGPTYLHAETETTLAKIGQVAGETIPALRKAIADQNRVVMAHGGGNVYITGPLIFVYQGATGEMDTPFKLCIGFAVAEGTKPLGVYKVKKLDDFRCATVLFSGPMAKVGEAYGKLFPALTAAGHTPTGETREYYLYWESDKSPNNILLIQAGIKGP
jgi:effector-binding domain-containing protein